MKAEKTPPRDIYLNNAATSWPKPEQVYRAVDSFSRNMGGSPGRGSSERAQAAGTIILECRQALAALFNIDNEEQIAFTLNATYAINMALKGLLQPGDHFIISGIEHNAVVRPANWLRREKGVDFSILPCDHEGRCDPEQAAALLRPSTRLLVCSHASNVCGTIQPIRELGAFCRERGLLFMVDAAQSAGVLPLDVKADGIHLLAFTGHKALLGPQGTGGLYVDPMIRLGTIIEGGTGSLSESMEQPEFMPDMLESGTPNTPGLAGLKAGIDYICEQGMMNIRAREIELTGCLLNGLAEISGLTVYGPQDARRRTAVVAMNLDNVDCGALAYQMEQEHGIISRSGLHCAPLAHEGLGILRQGSCRISLGCFTTEHDVEQAVRAVYDISKHGSTD